MAVSRITITVPLPDDVFERAAVLTEIRTPIESLRQALPVSATVHHEIVNPRAPRKEKPEKRSIKAS